jgi:hypothetical protein
VLPRDWGHEPAKAATVVGDASSSRDTAETHRRGVVGMLPEVCCSFVRVVRSEVLRARVRTYRNCGNGKPVPNNVNVMDALPERFG